MKSNVPAWYKRHFMNLLLPISPDSFLWCLHSELCINHIGKPVDLNRYFSFLVYCFCYMLNFKCCTQHNSSVSFLPRITLPLFWFPLKLVYFSHYPLLLYILEFVHHRYAYCQSLTGMQMFLKMSIIK